MYNININDYVIHEQAIRKVIEKLIKFDPKIVQLKQLLKNKQITKTEFISKTREIIKGIITKHNHLQFMIDPAMISPTIQKIISAMI